MPGPWTGSAEAYARSFARLCAGAAAPLIDAIGPADGPTRLLDVGTGPGTAAEAAHQAGFDVVGMDTDPSMVKLARQRHPHLRLAVAALPHLPSRDRRFDVVIANFVLNHMPDPRRAAREVFRVTRPGGRVAATIWTAGVGPMNQLWNDVLREAGVEPLANVRLPPELDFERTAAGFAAVLQEAGFREIECREIDWVFRIPRDDLWLAVEAGIAVIGQTFTAQDPSAQDRMRQAYLRLTDERHPGGILLLPSTALLARGHRPSVGRCEQVAGGAWST